MHILLYTLNLLQITYTTQYSVNAMQIVVISITTIVYGIM
jgi:hypothetical protein